MTGRNNCKLAYKPKDFDSYLAHEYILKHETPVNNQNSDFRNNAITSEMIKERTVFTARLMKIQRNFQRHMAKSGMSTMEMLFPSNPSTQKKIKILSYHVDVVYLAFTEHLDCFEKKSTKRSRLRKKMETKILEVDEKMQDFANTADNNKGQNVKIYGVGSDYDPAESCSGYENTLYELLIAFSEEIPDYIRQLKNELTTWQKVCSWLRTHCCCITGRCRRNRRSYNLIV